MWAEIEAASVPLIIASSVGYLSTCLLTCGFRIPHTLLPIRVRRVGMALLALVNIGTGIATLTAKQPNVGTLTEPLGFLAYFGIVAVLAAGLTIFPPNRKFSDIVLCLIRLVLAIYFLVSAGWIMVAWGSALLEYIPSFWISLLSVIGLSTVVMRTRQIVRRPNEYAHYLFGVLLSLEATAIFTMANILLLVFLGLVFHP